MLCIAASLPSVVATQYLASSNGANQSFGANDLLFLDNTNGYVGVNTTAPSGLLNFVGPSETQPANTTTTLISWPVTSFIFASEAKDDTFYFVGAYDTTPWKPLFFSYDLNTEALTNLSPTAAGNWIEARMVGSDYLGLGSAAPYNATAVYVTGDNSTFGVYNPVTNITYDLTGTDTGDWLSTTAYITAKAYNATTVYVSGSWTNASTGSTYQGILGIYNPATNITTRYAAAALDDVVIYDLVPHNSTAVYLAGQEHFTYNPYFGVFNPQTGLVTNLTSLLTAGWNTGYVGFASILPWNDTRAYLLSDSGVFSWYNPSANTVTDSALTITADYEADESSRQLVRSYDNASILVSDFNNGVERYDPDADTVTVLYANGNGASLYPRADRTYLGLYTQFGYYAESNITTQASITFDNGNLGISTSTPQSALEVNGDVLIQGISDTPILFVNASAGTVSINAYDATEAFTVNGDIVVYNTIYANAHTPTLNDFAETMLAEETLQPGTIVMTTGADSVQKATKALANQAIGVVSATPGIVLGNSKETNTVPVAFSGRVSVSVTGSVEAGDFIAVSDAPGVGEAAREAGFVVGRALTPAQNGKVTMLVQPTYFNPQVTAQQTLVGAPEKNAVFEGSAAAETQTTSDAPTPQLNKAGDSVEVSLGAALNDVVITLG